MDRRKLYGVWLPTDELLGIPLVAYHWLRGKKIRDLLFEKLHEAREKSKNGHLSEKDITELKIQYDELDNVFSDWFKQIEKSPNHTFQEKIDYCLKRFRTESLRNLTASRTLILQENFLKGAEKTLVLYFQLNENPQIVETTIFGEQLPQSKESVNFGNNQGLELANVPNPEIAEVFEAGIETKDSVTNKLLPRQEDEKQNFEALRDFSIDIELFDKIDFSKLKEYNIIYNQNVEGLQLKQKPIGDFLILISYLEKMNVIAFTRKKKLAEIKIILNEVLGKKVDSSRISRINNRIVNNEGTYNLSSNEDEILFQAKDFYNIYVKPK